MRYTGTIHTTSEALWKRRLDGGWQGWFGDIPQAPNLRPFCSIESTNFTLRPAIMLQWPQGLQEEQELTLCCGLNSTVHTRNDKVTIKITNDTRTHSQQERNQKSPETICEVLTDNYVNSVLTK